MGVKSQRQAFYNLQLHGFFGHLLAPLGRDLILFWSQLGALWATLCAVWAQYFYLKVLVCSLKTPFSPTCVLEHTSGHAAGGFKIGNGKRKIENGKPKLFNLQSTLYNLQLNGLPAEVLNFASCLLHFALLRIRVICGYAILQNKLTRSVTPDLIRGPGVCNRNTFFKNKPNFRTRQVAVSSCL